MLAKVGVKSWATMLNGAHTDWSRPWPCPCSRPQRCVVAGAAGCRSAALQAPEPRSPRLCELGDVVTRSCVEKATVHFGCVTVGIGLAPTLLPLPDWFNGLLGKARLCQRARPRATRPSLLVAVWKHHANFWFFLICSTAWPLSGSNALSPFNVSTLCHLDLLKSNCSRTLRVVKLRRATIVRICVIIQRVHQIVIRQHSRLRCINVYVQINGLSTGVQRGHSFLDLGHCWCSGQGGLPLPVMTTDQRGLY